MSESIRVSVTPRQPVQAAVILSKSGNSTLSIDSTLSLSSTNPVQNKVITEALNAKPDAYVHQQLSAASLWTINHNLGYEPLIQIKNAGGLVVDAEISHISPNIARILLTLPLSGLARCV